MTKKEFRYLIADIGYLNSFIRALPTSCLLRPTPSPLPLLSVDSLLEAHRLTAASHSSSALSSSTSYQPESSDTLYTGLLSG